MYASHSRIALCLIGGALTVAFCAACGGGDESEPPSAAEGASAAPAAAPAAPQGPFQAHAATLQQMRTQLETLARRQASAFSNPSNASSSINPNNVGRDPLYMSMMFHFGGGPGSESPFVSATVALLPDGRVVMTNIVVRASGRGGPALTTPAPIGALAQAVRLAIMDGDCNTMPIPVAMDRARGTFSEHGMNQAAEVRTKCVEARGAFNGAALVLKSVRVSSVYAERPGHGVITSLSARLRSGAQLGLSRPQFSLAR